MLCIRAQVAAVGHITVYLRRYVTNDVRRMLIIVPGLSFRKIDAAAAAAAANPSNNATVTASPLTTPLPTRGTVATNGASGMTTGHAGNLAEPQTVGLVSAPVQPILQPISTSDPGSAFVDGRPFPPPVGSLPLGIVRGLSPMTTTSETEVQHYRQYQTGPITSLHHKIPTTGSRVQSDIF